MLSPLAPMQLLWLFQASIVPIIVVSKVQKENFLTKIHLFFFLLCLSILFFRRGFSIFFIDFFFFDNKMRNAGREKISIATRSVLTTKHNNSPLLRFAVVSCLCCAVSIWSLFPLPLRNGRADGWMEGAVTKRRRFHFHSVLDFWLFFFFG